MSLADLAEVRATALQARDLFMSFRDSRGREHVVLQTLNLEILRGEFVCVVGASGCGKSTLLNILAGFLTPTRGEIVAAGAPVLGPDPSRVVVFQEPSVFPWMTVRQNVEFGLGHRLRPERALVAQRFISLVGLGGREEAYPRELSGGMRQRVEIARALAADPQVVFMDEPFGALDHFTRLRLREDLVEVWRRTEKTIVFVTHDVDEAVQLADRILVLSPALPGNCAEIQVSLPRPRSPDRPQALALRSRILTLMKTEGGRGSPPDINRWRPPRCDRS